MDKKTNNQKPTNNLTLPKPAQNEISLLTTSLVKSRDSNGSKGRSVESITATTPIRIASSSQPQKQDVTSNDLIKDP
ncbi:7795_t:CDS:1, partial [Ambispora leptoticha]